jgi:hypothetical protein
MAEIDVLVDGNFYDLNVHVTFDRDTYGDLLSYLSSCTSTELTEEQLPYISMVPAEEWSMPRPMKVLHAMSMDKRFSSTSRYNPETKAITITADEDVAVTNQLLLHATRLWSADMSGELLAADEYNFRSRKLRYTEIMMGIIAGSYAGERVDGVRGVALGGVVGFAGGLAVASRSIANNPYYKNFAGFSRDVEMIRRYGEIINYEPLSRSSQYENGPE